MMSKSLLAVLLCSFGFISGFVEQLGLNARLRVQESSPLNGSVQGDQRMTSDSMPVGFDWRFKEGVSPVKDQGECDAGWAFSAVASMESQIWMRGLHTMFLSEQFLIDCNTMGAGCGHAGVVNTFADIVANIGGMMIDKHYEPYEHHKEQCRWDHNGGLVPVVGLRRIKPLDEKEMVRILLSHGPLSAGINNAMMKAEKRDPFAIDQPTEEQCPSGKEHLNHAVLIVGYNVYKGADGKEIPYWIIKNSWGEAWGADGYYYLQRGTNACGIAVEVAYGIMPDSFQGI